ncbi:MAG TPA: metallophosphoesterase [Ilumatobacteraceae bacterium]|nr:metallophosphoesterase [Ilumatobacteraceae bacterium]
MTPRPARLLHTSDCHLDALDNGPCQRAFAASIDLAISTDVDAIVISGDLFDHARVAPDILDWTAMQLDRAERPVVLLTGNHDALHDTSVHHRFVAEQRCRAVSMLDNPGGSSVEIPGTDVVVWGRAMVEHSPEYQPLLGSPSRVQGRWLVIAAHGLATATTAPGRSSVIPHTDLDALDADYVALGHIHAHQVVRNAPLAVYPGATARSFDGQAGCVIVDLAPGRATTATWTALTWD